MKEWTRAQVWAEHDAEHVWRMRIRVVATCAVLILAWSTILFVGYAAEVARSAPLIHLDTNARIECACDDDRAQVVDHMTCCGDRAARGDL